MAPPRRTSAQRLREIAAELLDADGHDAVTMRGVGDRAGISATALYRHYADRAALLDAVVDHAFDELAARFASLRVPGDPVASLEGMLLAFVELFLQRPHLFAQMFVVRRVGARVLPLGVDSSPTLRLVADQLRAGVRHGLFVDDDPDEVATSGAALVQGLCTARHAGRIVTDDEAFRDLVGRAVRRYLRGVARSRPPDRRSGRDDPPTDC